MCNSHLRLEVGKHPSTHSNTILSSSKSSSADCITVPDSNSIKQAYRFTVFMADGDAKDLCCPGRSGAADAPLADGWSKIATSSISRPPHPKQTPIISTVFSGAAGSVCKQSAYKRIFSPLPHHFGSGPWHLTLKCEHLAQYFSLAAFFAPTPHTTS